MLSKKKATYQEISTSLALSVVQGVRNPRGAWFKPTKKRTSSPQSHWTKVLVRMYICCKLHVGNNDNTHIYISSLLSCQSVGLPAYLAELRRFRPWHRTTVCICIPYTCHILAQVFHCETICKLIHCATNIVAYHWGYKSPHLAWLYSSGHRNDPSLHDTTTTCVSMLSGTPEVFFYLPICEGCWQKEGEAHRFWGKPNDVIMVV